MRLGLACLILITGCDLYFTDGDDDPPCAVADLAPAQQLRNPDTGECQAIGFPGCDDICGVCAADVASPDWGSCFAGCESLDEFTCISAPDCRAVYDANSDIDIPPQFIECWSIAPSGPVTGRCEGLDAYACSQHADCSAYYDTFESFSFFECREEKVDVCGTVDCAPNTHCEAHCTGLSCAPMCVPDTDLCATMDCAPGTECVQTCQDTNPETPGCGICDAQCRPLGTCETAPTEQACADRIDCRTVYNGDNCTCSMTGVCTCEDLEYARCEPE